MASSINSIQPGFLPEKKNNCAQCVFFGVGAGGLARQEKDTLLETDLIVKESREGEKERTGAWEILTYSVSIDLHCAGG